MTDWEVLARARQLCDRGDLLPGAEYVQEPRLRRRVSSEDALETCSMVPALVEMIERRGLGT